MNYNYGNSGNNSREYCNQAPQTNNPLPIKQKRNQSQGYQIRSEIIHIKIIQIETLIIFNQMFFQKMVKTKFVGLFEMNNFTS